MPDDSLLETHREWLGYVQPVGLLVAPAALVHRGVLPDRNVTELQERLDEATRTEGEPPTVRDFPDFAREFLGWDAGDLAGAPGGPELPTSLGVTLIEYEERLVPTFAVPGPDGIWQMLVQIVEAEDFDQAVADDGKHWPASVHARFERLLRETDVPVGLLTNKRLFRLVYAPKGESSGYATFDLDSMLQVSGRPMLSAFHMLLRVERFFGVPEQSLGSLFALSREYQQDVSTKLALQVLVALNELLRGFATSRSGRDHVIALVKDDPEHLYNGLLSALLRLVFTLYAEDRDLFAHDEVWEQNYSLGGLFERLRDDAALFPDTMDDRYGAWGQLLALWRLVYGGGRHGKLELVARRGQLFDPDRFPFLEGRVIVADAPVVPAISDGVVWRILQALMVLDGERLSYRTLDVEQIGSVYQSIMGFTIELTTGPSLAIRPQQKKGASATIDLEALLREASARRPEWLKKRTDRKLTTRLAGALKDARSVADIEAALESVVDRAITPRMLPAGVPVLQPTETRRRSGTHYTPRTLTEPIVAEALRPILDRLGPEVRAEELLGLKILDPAVGSGAFLVEACRQISERVVAAWERHGHVPRLPPDEDALLHARRLVVQRCLYGVDRNPMAADLAKLSLWLTTLARDHQFTFVDHAIRSGDGLVGLSPMQIESVSWKPTSGVPFVAESVRNAIASAQRERESIRAADEDVPESDLRAAVSRANEQLRPITDLANAVIAAFFSGDRRTVREKKRQQIVGALGIGDPAWHERLMNWSDASHGILARLTPFHWQLEFPEVFLRENPGFDCIVGNPPYAGKNTIIAGNPSHYIDWLQVLHDDAHGNADLVAHFFRRGYDLLRSGGALGFVATKTIRQGATRETGLAWIRSHGAQIYHATRRYKWPGEAAVTVAIVHVLKGRTFSPLVLDGRDVNQITSFLFDSGGDRNPLPLAGNAGKAFIGSYPLGMGFTFDDAESKGVASSLSTMRELIERNPENAEIIKPFMGGEEILEDPRHRHYRYIIDFDDFSLEDAQQYPDLLDIVRTKVKPQREGDKRAIYRNAWWRYAERRKGLYKAIASLPRVLVTPQTAARFAFVFLPNGMVYGHRLVVIADDSWQTFAVLQSRVHQLWALFFGYSLEDRPCYSPERAFMTFPFPDAWLTNSEIGIRGERYYDQRAAMLIQLDEGITKLYNRFHDPGDTTAAIQDLRRSHGELDRAVLDSYGWQDVSAVAQFFPAESGDDDVEYTWPTDVRDEVLGRLLKLNAERAAAEARSGIAISAINPDNDAGDDTDDTLEGVAST